VITAKIVDLDQNEPPNPVADDRNDNYTKPSVPSNAQVISSSWGVWRPWWHAYWVWHSTGDDSGYWCDHGWWEFDYDRYHASLSASMSIKPDDKNSTASGKTMKSGYGINQTVTANVSTNQSSAVTKVFRGCLTVQVVVTVQPLSLRKMSIAPITAGHISLRYGCLMEAIRRTLG
jgi:hypothetical protein